MIFKNIKFSNYKLFEKEQHLEVKPITILIGKNSAGKSSLLKLPLLLLNSITDPVNGILNTQLTDLDLAYEYKDLLYNKYETRELSFKLEINLSSEVVRIEVSIQNIPEKERQIISKYTLSSDKHLISLKGTLEDSYEVFYTGDIDGTPIDKTKGLRFTGLLPWSTKFFNVASQIDLISSKYRAEFFQLENKFKYLRPFRAFPKRIYENRTINSNYDFDGSSVPKQILEDERLRKKISAWCRAHLELNKIVVNKIDREGKFFEINIQQYENDNVEINLFDVGQGISQSLPVVTRAFMDRTGMLEIVEQPELHLHPAAHGALAELLINSARQNKESAYIIETHSENFLLRTRRCIAEGKIPKEFVHVYWVDFDEIERNATIKKINIDDNGEVDFWPEGIFSESFEEVKAIRRAQRKIVEG